MNNGCRSILLIFVCGISGCVGSSDSQPTQVPSDQVPRKPDAVSLFGDPLYSPAPSEELLAKLEKRKLEFESDPGNPDKLIWYGRFLAYCGDYEGAIELFLNGAKKFPEDARLLRHAGHRYISVRKFDKAVDVLERAAKLIKDQENQIEPDGMPNPRNIPVSTLHGNIWYHLGLAYYLKHDFEIALRAYENCLATADRPDNVVSATHWIYMIHRRLGREAAARKCLEPISREMDVIENMGYHQCCCFYKGLIKLDDLEGAIQDGLQREAIDYAIANWFWYNDEPEKALNRLEALKQEGAWNAFGFIAAESDLALIKEVAQR